MRPLSRVSTNNKSSQQPVSTQVARRRELRRQRRQTLLIQLWRFVALLLVSGGFSWILLRHGWTLRSPEALILTGGTALEANQVIEAAKLRFPQPLLEVSPRALEQQLIKSLPVQSAHVQRRMLPARLLISLKPEIPVAKAVRQGPFGRERGLLNAEGQWIPLSDALPEPLTEIVVRGWNDQQRSQIAALLQQRDRFEGRLKAIVLHPDGNVSLITTALGQIDLGGEPALLNAQIETIVHLNKTLPKQLRQAHQSSLDLSNPDRPELQLPTPPEPKKVKTQP
ncbi:FtsQ-type POTRA domain-containing protein [Synechococcus sp. YX-04-1]|uniref:cell division protein FtsQ/DivIB n=1 Tax=unclassified Synechococcus TaxID=2626047 RepID=UPI001CF8DE6F|nr:FtsQ-type POTRA domain-containing protein [Synechococcus sp. YX-04-1]MDO6352375.1 FtsQ-type POTRA domain-containing protein [Synechococcus sp. YX-04-1]